VLVVRQPTSGPVRTPALSFCDRKKIFGPCVLRHRWRARPWANALRLEQPTGARHEHEPDHRLPGQRDEACLPIEESPPATFSWWNSSPSSLAYLWPFCFSWLKEFRPPMSYVTRWGRRAWA